ncbi:hypothetical protein EYF80_053041 [Liparis tanakae]|uniref:Uncharacterized protein n=1 Tax=Liparis tanakae TaxID=230148 RepID=A0A4Z2F6A7_9TELE|nr:hypothetical protein EYF80_053041 [Liparis tanakae]
MLDGPSLTSSAICSILRVLSNTYPNQTIPSVVHQVTFLQPGVTACTELSGVMAASDGLWCARLKAHGHETSEIDLYSCPGLNSKPRLKGVKSWNFSEKRSGPSGPLGRLHSQRLKPRIRCWQEV